MTEAELSIVIDPDNAAQVEIQKQAREAVDAADLELQRSRRTPIAILKEELTGRFTRRTRVAEAGLQEAINHSRAVTNMFGLTYSPQPFGTYKIGGFLVDDTITGIYDGILRDIDITTRRVRKFSEDGGAGTFGLETTAAIEGRASTTDVTGRIIDIYLKPLKDRDAIKRKIVSSAKIPR